MKKILTIFLIILTLGAVSGSAYFVVKNNDIITLESKIKDVELSIKFQFDNDDDPKYVRYIGVIENFNFEIDDVEYFYWKITNQETGELKTYSINTLYTSINGIDNSVLGDDIDFLAVLVNEYVSSIYDVELYLKFNESDAISYCYRECELP